MSQPSSTESRWGMNGISPGLCRAARLCALFGNTETVWLTGRISNRGEEDHRCTNQIAGKKFLRTELLKWAALDAKKFGFLFRLLLYCERQLQFHSLLSFFLYSNPVLAGFKDNLDQMCTDALYRDRANVIKAGDGWDGVMKRQMGNSMTKFLSTIFTMIIAQEHLMVRMPMWGVYSSF